MRTNNQLQNDFGFTDLLLVIGVGVNILSLIVNNKNNVQLDKINDNLTEINKNKVLEKIEVLASGGK